MAKSWGEEHWEDRLSRCRNCGHLASSHGGVEGKIPCLIFSCTCNDYVGKEREAAK